MSNTSDFKPRDPGTLGAYAKGLRSGIMAAGLTADSQVFHFRWAHATRICVVESVRIWAGNLGTAFAAGGFNFRLFRVQAWSADGSGGNAGTFTGANGKKRNRFATSSGLTMRVSSTAALTAGTQGAIDSDPIGQAGGSVTATAGTSMLPGSTELLQPSSGKPYDLILTGVAAAEEGFIVTATVPATGTWTFGVDVCWVELTAEDASS